MKKPAFERYAPFIQEYIYKKKWTDLRDVQVEACEAILDTDKHVIIASGTASGKTEAAFFPILTLLEKNPAKSIGIMYIGPLKALINDQFERLDVLLENQEIPVWPWHGEISQTMKKRALGKARGVLQITPESLESLLMRHPADARRLFSDLRFIIIDEIHAFMGADRGLQVQCLIARLERLTGCRPRRVGLSATLNEYESAMEFLAAGSERGVVAVGIQGQKRKLALCAESYIVPENREAALNVMEQYNNFIYDQCHKKKCLIFTNSRAGAEQVIADMKEIAGKRGERDVFHVHHGSISGALRKEVEHTLRDHDGPTVAAATLTLELGIDIGSLDSTIQLGAPFTCSSFVQRLGRSGRRSGKSQMLFVNVYEENQNEGMEALPWDLLRSIAIIQLYLEEQWVEPFAQKKKPFSLLAHQTLSILKSHTELTPAQLAGHVLFLPPFVGNITQDEYRELLLFMLQKEYLERTESGGIIIGLKGEPIVNNYHFYAVFQEEEAYRVLCKGDEIGTLSKCPPIGELFLLAGKTWRAIAIDEGKKCILAVPAQGANVPNWEGKSGDVHEKIMKRIRKVLEEDVVYPYLQEGAAELLAFAREYAREHGLLEDKMVPQNEKQWLIRPWTGSREIRTMEKLFSYGLREELALASVSASPYDISIVSGLGAKGCKERLKELAETGELDFDDPGLVLKEDQAPKIDKYDFMVPERLLRVAFLQNQTDVKAALEICLGFLCVSDPGQSVE